MVFIEILTSAALQLVYIAGTALSMGFILGIMGKQSQKYIIAAFGRRAIMLTAVIGTPVHELGHAIMGVLFGHRINKLKLLQLPDENGVLGYVHHSYNSKNLYQRSGLFFIGLAPLFSGIAVILGLMAVCLPESFSTFIDSIEVQRFGIETLNANFELAILLLNSIFNPSNFKVPLFWIFIFLSTGIASHIALSKADIVQCRHGLTVIFLCLVLINGAGAVLGMDISIAFNFISNLNSYLLSTSLLAIIFSGVGLVVGYIAFKIKRIILG